MADLHQFNTHEAIHISASVALLGDGLLALQLPNALPALLQQPHTHLHDLLLLVTQPRQQAPHQCGLVLLQELGSHVLEQVCGCLQSCPAHLGLGVCEGQFKRELQVLEVAACPLSDEQPREGDEGVPADGVLVVLEVFGEGLGDGCGVLAHTAPELGAELVEQFAGPLRGGWGTFLISALGSRRHLASAAASSDMCAATDSLKVREARRRRMIFSRRSSLFSGKGVLLMRWMSPWTSGSASSFLRAAPASSRSSRSRVASRLASMGSARVKSRFLARLVEVSMRTCDGLVARSSSFCSVASPPRRMLRSASVRQLIGRCSACSSPPYSSPSIQINLNSHHHPHHTTPATQPTQEAKERYSFYNPQQKRQMSKAGRREGEASKAGRREGEGDRNALTVRLQEIVEVLYRNNGQFARGLPSEQGFREMLGHCFNCYDQLDFIILEYSRHPVNYLEPKVVAEHMHRIMRVTKYLLGNLRHWVEAYSLDLLRKAQEERSYFPTHNTHNARCTTCHNYLEELIIKDAREEILGAHAAREQFEQELREADDEEEARKPLTAQETTEYVGSVNFLTKIIREMEDSAHGYNKLTETIEKEDSQEDMAMRLLEDLMASMRRRLGEKCIYRLKRVLKSWEKSEFQDHQHLCKKPIFKITHIINENYSPLTTNIEVKKNPQASISSGLLKKFKEENHQLQIQFNTLSASYNAAKTSLAFLEKREDVQRREIQRLSDLLNENALERSTLVKELRASKRNTIDPQVTLTITHKEVLPAAHKEKTLTATHKAKKYSKFKVKRLSRQSDAALSSATDKTLDFTSGHNLNQEEESAEAGVEVDDNDTSEDFEMIDVGCQWEDLYCNERGSKLKDKSSRASKMVKSNTRERPTIAKIAKIDEEEVEQGKKLKEKKLSVKGLDISVKSKPSLQPDLTRLSIEDQKNFPNNDNHTLKRLLENQQQRISHLQLRDPENHKVSVKVLETEPSVHKISLEKINIYGNSPKVRELKPLILENKVIISRDLPEPNNENHFANEIKKIMNLRVNTEGSEVARKALKVRNSIFKPEHLSLFGGVSESYAYERAVCTEDKLNEQEKRYFSELKRYLVNLRGFKNHLYDNIVIFMKTPYTLIDKDELEIKIMGDKQLSLILKKFITFHHKKCQRLCEHLHNFNALIGLTNTQ